MNRSLVIICAGGLASAAILLASVGTASAQAVKAQTFRAQTAGSPTRLDAAWARDDEIRALRGTSQARRNAALDTRSVDPAFTPPDAGAAVLIDTAPYAVAESGRDVFGPVVDFRDPDLATPALDARRLSAVAAVERHDIWRESGGYSERLRLTTRGDLRRLDGAPLPPTARDAAAFDIDGYTVSYMRGWEVARGRTASGLEVTLIPHAGLGVGDGGGSAEAGATIRIEADDLAPNGAERFGERARWYLYAAGSGRAVGYNFARNRDGDYARSGMSHDTGAFLGDASIGVAYRRGDLQGSFGVVYREIKAEGLTGEGIDTDVTEGLVAFQLSFKPQR